MPRNKENSKSLRNNKKQRTNSKIREVIFTIKPIIICHCVIGIFRFSTEKDELVPPNKKMIFFGISMLATCMILFITFMKIPQADIEDYIDLIDEVPVTVVIIQYAFCILTSPFLLCTTYINIFKTFADLDLTLLITTKFYEASRCETKKCLFLMTALYVVCCILDAVTDDEIIWYKIVLLPFLFSQNLEILLFCELIVMVTGRLKIVNNFLSNFIENKNGYGRYVFTLNKDVIHPEEKYDWIGRASTNNMKIRDLAISYDKIGMICAYINTLFDFQIFTSILSTFIYIIIAIWTSIYYYRTSQYNFGFLMTIVIWCIALILFVATMSVVCERLLLVRDNTRVLVNKIIMDYNLPKTMRIQAKSFMELIEVWPLRFCIYDMFSVDITLMLKFINVATTYLIVIIQLSHFF